MKLNQSRAQAPVVLCFILCGMITPCRADKFGEALLQECIAAEMRTQGIKAHFTHQFSQRGELRVQTGTLLLKKPNLAHILVVSDRQEKASRVVIHSDGRRFVTYSSADNVFSEESADPSGGNVARNNLFETYLFFDPDQLNRIRESFTGVRTAGRITVGGTNCRILQFQGNPDLTLKLYIGPEGLLRGAAKVYRGERDETHLTQLRQDAGLTQALLRWKPPQGAKTAEQVQASMAAQAQGQQAASLLPIGRKAPVFTLPTANGGRISLAQAVSNHRALLLNFWSYF